MAGCPGKAAAGDAATLRFNLYHAPGETAPLRTLEIRSRLAPGVPLELRFEPLDDPPGQAYYLTVESAGNLGLRGRSEDMYPGGSAYLNGSPLDADLAFTTTYDYGPAAAVLDFAALLRSAWLALPLGLILFLPGWLLLGRAYPSAGPGVRLALALGLSLSLPPVVMTWTTLAGLPWSRPAVLAAAGLLCALGFWQARARKSLTPPAAKLPPPLPKEGGAQLLSGVVRVSPPPEGEGRG